MKLNKKLEKYFYATLIGEKKKVAPQYKVENRK